MKHTVSRWLAILLAQFSMLCYADFELGLRFYDNKQFDKAFPLFLEAAQYGDYDAQNNVGVMYYRGEHVNQHIPTAYAWFALAAQSPAFKEKGLHERIFARLSNEEKKIAEEKRSLAVQGNQNDKLSYAMFLSSVPSLVKEYKPQDNPNEWLMAAAQQGSSTAGFFLGRNILYGDMCTQDTQQSYGWLTQSAKNGLSEAQYMLAMESFSGARFEKNEEKGFYWLARAAEHSAVAKVRYAWLLSTYPDENRRDGKLAAQLLDKIDKQYYDLQGLYSARAAVAAENKDFKKALRWQKALIEDAEGLGLPHDHLKVILASYQAQKPWRETP